jgi:glucosylceramidase
MSPSRIAQLIAVIALSTSGAWAADRCTPVDTSVSCIPADNTSVNLMSMIQGADAAVSNYEAPDVEGMITNPSQGWFAKDLALGSPKTEKPPLLSEDRVLDLKGKSTCQEMRGFGFTMTESSAITLNKLSPEQRKSAMHKLFDPNSGAGMNYVILPLSSNDFSDPKRGDFSVCDCKSGEDPTQGCFHPERIQEEIDLLQQAQSLNPDLKLMLKPWSPPPYMKDLPSDNKGNPYYGHDYDGKWNDAYASCLAKAVQYVQGQGLKVQSIAAQNEPGLKLPYPSSYFSDDAHADLLSKLEKRLQQENLNPQIVVRSDNYISAWDARGTLDRMKEKPEHPVFDGHCYSNDPDDVKHVLGKQKDFCSPNDTGNLEYILGECSATGNNPDYKGDFDWWANYLIGGNIEQGASGALGWNAILGPDFGPKNHGCSRCRGLLSVTDDQKVKENPEYYAIEQYSKYIQPGAVRQIVDSVDGVDSLVFKNPDESEVAILSNKSDSFQALDLMTSSCKHVPITLPPGAVISVKIR